MVDSLCLYVCVFCVCGCVCRFAGMYVVYANKRFSTYTRVRRVCVCLPVGSVYVHVPYVCACTTHACFFLPLTCCVPRGTTIEVRRLARMSGLWLEEVPNFAFSRNLLTVEARRSVRMSGMCLEEQLTNFAFERKLGTV